ncbi:MAG: HD domain-containing protein [Treponema sp.]|jgi:putative two-component system response regulator|nr:HD domain-containing protein [Treponema sp.]
MAKKHTADKTEEADVPDELEEIEEIGELGELAEESVDTEAYLSPETNPFVNSIFPVLFVNRQLRILFANKVCAELFNSFDGLAGNYMTDIFGKFFEREDIRAIRETLLKGNNGYSWKGEVKIKSRETATMLTKIYIFPTDISQSEPSEFVVLLDDVTGENKSLLRSVFLSLLEASKLKDNDTGKHIIRVQHYSQRLARELFNKKGYERIDADFIDNIGFLSTMHDVGKIGTPDDILNKEGPLSDWEWTVMQEHTKNGAFILSTYPNPMAKEIALSHHERWNGSGYPFKLEGDMIPLAARIVSIADVYDALRMQRSYKPPIEHEKTVEKMMESKNTHFDPALIDVFYAIAEDFEQLYEAHRDSEK